MQHPDKGYRRIRDDLEHDFGINVNDKRVLRICRAKKIKSTIKYRNCGCTRNASNPQYVAENVLGRDFHASKPNVKWLTNTVFPYVDETVKDFETAQTTDAEQSASGWAKIRAKLINTGIDLVWGVTKKVVTKILEKADANEKAPAQA